VALGWVSLAMLCVLEQIVSRGQEGVSGCASVIDHVNKCSSQVSVPVMWQSLHLRVIRVVKVAEEEIESGSRKVVKIVRGR
jgi:hypothetical protein